MIGPAGIAQRKHARDFVVGFAGGVVARAADARVVKIAARRSPLPMSRDRERCGRRRRSGRRQAASGVASGGVRLQKHRVDMALEMIDADQRLFQRHGERFAVGDADQKRADQARAARDGNGVESRQSDLRSLKSFAHNRHDLPQMLARGKLRNHAAIFAVNINLRRNDAGKNAAPIADNGRGGLVAGRLDAEDQIFVRSQRGVVHHWGMSENIMVAWRSGADYGAS